MGAHPSLESRVLYARSGASPETAWAAASEEARAAAAGTAGILRGLGARALLSSDPDYPRGFGDLPDPPRVLFVRGRLPARPAAVALVGSRAASPYGLACARRLAGDLAGLGYVVASGLARGIDAAAHRGALDAGGSSVGVLPCGLDRVAPSDHCGLAEALCERGGIVSEWPAGPPFGPGAYVTRNRLIAAYAAATVVVEAAEDSGALGTAAVARRLGRPVLAVPGDVDRPTARGVHALIKSGVRLCECAGDVVAALAAAGCGDEPESPEGRLLAVLGETPRAAESLAAAAGLPLDRALASLLRLEWSGVAAARPGQRWVRVAG